MFRPLNGRIMYAFDRIAVMFSHYNVFNLDPIDCHTGDAMVTFDLKG